MHLEKKIHFSDDFSLSYIEIQGPRSLKAVLITLCSFESTLPGTCTALSPQAFYILFGSSTRILACFWHVTLCGCVIIRCRQSKYTHIFTKLLHLLELENGRLFFLSSGFCWGFLFVGRGGLAVFFFKQFDCLDTWGQLCVSECVMHFPILEEERILQ